jgi:peptidoglycan DL-endopeptidase CwlO
VHTWPSGSKTLIRTMSRRSVAVAGGLLAVGALVVSVGGAATAAPQPSVSQVQAELNQLNNQGQQIDQQYAQAEQQLTSADAQLAAINTEVVRDRARYNLQRRQVAEIAVAAYKMGNLTSPEVLLTEGDPQQILDKSSILLELSSSNDDLIHTFLADARQLAEALQAAQRISDGKKAIVAQLAAKKDQNAKLVAQQQALLAQLTPAQQDTGLGSGSTGTLIVPHATSAQAQTAINFAYQQVVNHCPYVFAGVGPCQLGFDCSGLTQAAWAAAGVSIPRTSYEQADLPSVPFSEVQVGDILEFAGDSHVGLYAGDNMLIDAPHTGLDVEEVPLSGWYSENLDEVVVP